MASRPAPPPMLTGKISVDRPAGRGALAGGLEIGVAKITANVA